MKNNFICSKCKKENFIPKYSTVIKNGEVIYKINGKEMICGCGGILIYIEKPFGVPFFGKFSSSSKEEKSKILKDRSHQHFKKHIADQRHEMSHNDKIY